MDDVRAQVADGWSCAGFGTFGVDFIGAEDCGAETGVAVRVDFGGETHFGRA